MVLFFESMYTEIFICFILYLFYLYTKRNLQYWEKLGVKFIKPLPFIGNAAFLVFSKKCTALYHQELYRKFPNEKFVGYYDFLTPTLILKDPDTIRSVIIKDSTYFHDRVSHSDGDLNPLNNNLAFSKGQQWKIIRSKLSTVFTTRKLKIMFEQLEECVDELCKILETKTSDQSKPSEIEVNSCVKNLIMNITGTCIFGLHLNCFKDTSSEFLKHSQKSFTFSLRFIVSEFLKVIHHRLPQILNFKDRAKDNEDFFINFVKDAIHIRKVSNIRRNDFLQLLIDLRNEEYEENCNQNNTNNEEEYQSENNRTPGNKISLMDDSVLAANMFIFLVAGVDTSGTAIALCLLELAVNLDIQEKLYREIKNILDMKDNNVSYYDIKNLKYLDWVTSETLRKYPTGGSFPRICTKAYKIPNTDVIIKEGVKVFVPSYAIHHDPEYYPDPEKFDPERFSEENKNARPPCTYLPFGDGPRHCIAMRFALIEIKVSLFKIISQFEFRVCDKTKFPVTFDNKSPMVVCEHDVWLRVNKRKNYASTF